jgi:hypothetical protein
MNGMKTQTKAYLFRQNTTLHTVLPSLRTGIPENTTVSDITVQQHHFTASSKRHLKKKHSQKKQRKFGWTEW